jgi:hypothetical protein
MLRDRRQGFRVPDMARARDPQHGGERGHGSNLQRQVAPLSRTGAEVVPADAYPAVEPVPSAQHLDHARFVRARVQ